LLNIGIIGAAFGISPLLDEPIIGIGISVLLGGIAQIILQVEISSNLKTLSVMPPAERSAGVIVESVEELVNKLKTEAKVI
jgi:peptidoglycan biosynthesis protein MviN/MurJ (putative lipid II flippase)